MNRNMKGYTRRRRGSGVGVCVRVETPSVETPRDGKIGVCVFERPRRKRVSCTPIEKPAKVQAGPLCSWDNFPFSDMPK